MAKKSARREVAYDHAKFSFRTFWSEEDRGYVTVVIERPTISGISRTPWASIRECVTALDLAVRVALEDEERFRLGG